MKDAIDAQRLLDQVRQIASRTAGRLSIGRGSPLRVRAGGRLETALLTFIEGVHFDLAFTSPAELGHKLLATALSDFASAGVRPRHALLSLGLTQSINEVFLVEFLRGMRRLAGAHDVSLTAGKSVPSPTMLAMHLVVFGEPVAGTERKRRARPGDLVAVTGTLGDSAAGLSCLKRLGRYQMNQHAALLEAHLLPSPPIAAAMALWKGGAMTSAIDVMEGLASDANELARLSGVGILIEESALPVSDNARKAARLITGSPDLWALYGAEDYQLLFTVRAEAAAAARKLLASKGTTMSLIGKVTDAEDGVRIQTRAGDINPLPAKAWNHLVRRRRAS